MNPIYLIDFYKVGHVVQYPDNITQVWSNWTPRSSRINGQNYVLHFGLQYFIKKYLIEEFNDNFFRAPLSEIIKEYKEIIHATLGVKNPKTDHIESLHHLGYLPLKIYSLPEGEPVSLGCPALVITNTHPDAYWLPNYLETLLSATLWKPTTSATTAHRYRKLFLKYAKEAGETDFSFVDWMGHDFSMRGMSGVEDAVLSGMGHLLSFRGTDSLPAILAAKKYYNAELSIGGSVPATEHSVMCAGSQDGELETFRRLIEDVYSSGIVSIVSDTWDLWKVLTDYIPSLKEKILRREGKLVIRPDSGDPVKIICGDDTAKPFSNEWVGAASLLERALGSYPKAGGRLIDKGGLIYGDSITVERAEAILQGLRKLNLSPYNMVFGIGSYTYEYVTRDTFGFAMKATAVRIDGNVVPIFKNPVTNSASTPKASHKGIPAVYLNEDYPAIGASKYVVHQEATEEQLRNCAFHVAFEDGAAIFDSFSEISNRVKSC